MGLTKQQLEALNVSSFPNNTAGLITPEILRTYNSSSIEATVNQDAYTTDSASFDSRIDGLATTSSLNAVSTSVGLLQTFSGSQYKADSASFSSRIEAVTGSGGNVDTSSLVTTSSFNAYTASQDFKNTTFATTGSNTFVGEQRIYNNQVLRFANQGTFSGDSGSRLSADSQTGIQFRNFSNNDIIFEQFGTASLNFYNYNGGIAITGSSTSIQGVDFIPFSSSLNSRINAITGSGGNIDTASFATTGSNTFVGNQTITGSVTISGSATSDLTVVGQIFVSTSAVGGTTVVPRITVSGSAGTSTINRNSITTRNDTNSAALNPSFIYNSDLTTNDEIGFSVDAAGGGVAGWTTGPAIYVNNDALDTYPAVFGFQNKANYTDGRVAVLTPLSASAGFTASLQDGYAWVGNSLGQNTQVATSSFGGGGGVGGATTGSNTFTGNQTIEGAIVSNPTTAITKLFSQAFVSGAVQLNITASNAISQSNLVFGGTELNAGQTGSVVISGSNNILLSAGRNNTLATGFSYGYLGGNNNIVVTIPTLNTGSLLTPTMTGNIGQGTFTMNFITSSLTAPSITNSIMNNTVTINHQSGSISYNNNINNTTFTSTANITNLPFLTTFNNNAFLGGTVTFNHISSSITALQNVGGGVTVNNNVSTSASPTTNGLSVNANQFGGSGNIIYTSGSGVTSRRNVIYNLFGGNTNVISASAFNSENQNLIGTAIWGTGLTVSATTNGTGTTAGGGAFFGRFNDITNLYNDSGKIVFAVGTGNSTSNRKTAFSIDSGSNVLISGSLIVSNPNTSGLSIDANAVVSGSKFYAGNSNDGLLYGPSSASLDNSYTRYGKDGFQIYQYQNQPYAFGVICTSDQLNAYTGSQFRWGTVNSLGPIQNYMNMISASYTGSIDGGSAIPGLDYLKNGEIVQFQRGTTFDKNVYIQQGLYVSQSGGGGIPALTLNGVSATALLATGSCTITGSLTLNGQTTFASLSNNTFTGNQIVSASIYIAPNSDNNQLYLPSGSNKQTGLATLNGGNPGTVTISNTNVTANSIIMLTKQTLAHPNGYVAISSKGSNTFTITSNHNGDTDVVAFMIINPS